MREKVTQAKKWKKSGAAILLSSYCRFAGDITSASQAAVLGTYQGIANTAKHILLDYSGVDYPNSSGIALAIQMLIAASKTVQIIQTFGLKPHFQKVFTMVGITKYTSHLPR